MIKRIMINSPVTKKVGYPVDGDRGISAILSNLQNAPENYCVVIHVIKGQSADGNGQGTPEIDSLIRFFTKRESEIFNLAMSGYSNKLIAEKLSITLETVKSHRKSPCKIYHA